MTSPVLETGTGLADPIQTTGPKITTPKERTLRTGTDRCASPTRVGHGKVNRCGGEAFVLAEFPFGVVRRYCGHHGTEAWDTILETAVSVVDERALINVAPSMSATPVG